MKRDTQNNEFLSLIYDLYDHVKFPKKEDIVKTEKKVGLFKKETVERNVALDSIKEKVDLFKRSLITVPPDFTRLWDFCEFVRVSEKVFFYPNKPDNYLYVEMDMNKRESGVRKFICNVNRFDDRAKSELRFTLERDLLGSDVISISVIRDFGLQMKNTYTIADGTVQYPDSSDLYLINEINFILQQYMCSIFSTVVEQIR